LERSIWLARHFGNGQCHPARPGKLYFSGSTTGGTNASINTWNGTQFTRLAQFNGSSGAAVYDLAFVGNTLYAGGFFTNVEGVAARGLARWGRQAVGAASA